MSILFLGTQMAVGGAQRVLLEQARWFHEAGYAVTAAFFYDKENLQARWQAQNPFPVVNLRADWNTGNLAVRVGRLLIALVRLWRLLRSRRVDIIETFTPHSNVLGLPIAFLAGVRVRVGSHHGRVEGMPRWLERLHGRLMNSRIVSGLVVVSVQVQQLVLQKEAVNPQKIRLIPNGVDIPRSETFSLAERSAVRQEMGVKEGEQVVITVGRLSYQKGHVTLLAAAPEILRRYPNTMFVLVGDGPARQELAHQAERLGIQHRVRFLGTRSDVFRWLAAADVFVLPSFSEGMPIALLEAMGMGLPVIASALDGIASVIVDGELGILVPPGEVSSLATAIQELLARPDLRQQLGERARHHVRAHYTLGRMCEQYEALFLQLTGGGR